mgnify:CR=1 FL=1
MPRHCPVSLWLGEDDQLRFAPIAELASLRGEALVDADNISGAEAQALLSSAEDAWPTLDQATRDDLLRHAVDWQSRTPEQRVLLRQRPHTIENLGLACWRRPGYRCWPREA